MQSSAFAVAAASPKSIASCNKRPRTVNWKHKKTRCFWTLTRTILLDLNTPPYRLKRHCLPWNTLFVCTAILHILGHPKAQRSHQNARHGITSSNRIHAWEREVSIWRVDFHNWNTAVSYGMNVVLHDQAQMKKCIRSNRIKNVEENQTSIEQNKIKSNQT